MKRCGIASSISQAKALRTCCSSAWEAVYINMGIPPRRVLEGASGGWLLPATLGQSSRYTAGVTCASLTDL